MAAVGTLRVATCQFPTSDDVGRNARYILRQIRQAKALRADVVHFPECALSGYAGTDFASWRGFDWAALKEETFRICSLAAELGLWVILGSTHRLSGRHLPHNSVYVTGPNGRIRDRYDKSFLTRRDLGYYTPGNHLPVFTINGVKCGALICFDLRFPEIYRAYKRRGVECIFQSFHNAKAEDGPNVWTTIMRPTLQANAASNYLWISASNASNHYQCWPSVFIRPDGTIEKSLRFHRTGVMVNTVNTRLSLYDPSHPFRAGVMKGLLHNGRLIADARSRNRRSL